MHVEKVHPMWLMWLMWLHPLASVIHKFTISWENLSNVHDFKCGAVKPFGSGRFDKHQQAVGCFQHMRLIILRIYIFEISTFHGSIYCIAYDSLALIWKFGCAVIMAKWNVLKMCYNFRGLIQLSVRMILLYHEMDVIKTLTKWSLTQNSWPNVWKPGKLFQQC